jgi:hypothetical protein
MLKSAWKQTYFKKIDIQWLPPIYLDMYPTSSTMSSEIFRNMVNEKHEYKSVIA